jgi:hypothetical protein
MAVSALDTSVCSLEGLIVIFLCSQLYVSAPMHPHTPLLLESRHEGTLSPASTYAHTLATHNASCCCPCYFDCLYAHIASQLRAKNRKSDLSQLAARGTQERARLG